MNQRSLFAADPTKDASGLVPASRRSDPVTSKIAARKVASKAADHRALILAELRRRDRQTAGELGKALGLTNVQVSRRLQRLFRALSASAEFTDR